ncbi:Cytochrome c oxidase subunit 5B, mitochondrial [Polyrhizophydium stewartii]|uniref:Cytochrome c oxidase subunit 5B, mitochondrial n=1 Tax=Polyrhizophydium stewartii TaxID=2732419 RepID=A0ABR4MXL5_9FUNG
MFGPASCAKRSREESGSPMELSPTNDSPGGTVSLGLGKAHINKCERILEKLQSCLNPGFRFLRREDIESQRYMVVWIAGLVDTNASWFPLSSILPAMHRGNFLFCNLKEVVKKATFTALLDDAIAIAKHAGIQDEECNGRSVIEHIKRIQKQHAQDWDEYEALTTTIEAFLVSPPPSAVSKSQGVQQPDFRKSLLEFAWALFLSTTRLASSPVPRSREGLAIFCLFFLSQLKPSQLVSLQDAASSVTGSRPQTSAAGTFGYFTAYFQKLCEALKVGEKDVDLLKSQLLVALMWCRESNLLKSGPPFKIKSLPWEEFPAAFDPGVNGLLHANLDSAKRLLQISAMNSPTLCANAKHQHVQHPKVVGAQTAVVNEERLSEKKGKHNAAWELGQSLFYALLRWFSAQFRPELQGMQLTRYAFYIRAGHQKDEGFYRALLLVALESVRVVLVEDVPHRFLRDQTRAEPTDILATSLVVMEHQASSKEILNGKLFIVTERLLSAEIWMDKEFKAATDMQLRSCEVELFSQAVDLAFKRHSRLCRSLKLSEKHTADSWSCVYKLLCLEPMLEIVSDRNVDIVVMLSIHTVGQLSDTKPSFKDITNAYSKTDFCSEERLASTSVISPSSLTHIEARWSKLPEAEQGAIADHLAELQKGDWKSLTLEQKRAIYFIAYGPYGARTPSDPALNRKVTAWVGAFLVATFGLWVAWESSKPQPKTFSKEWVEAQDKLAIERKQNPFSGAYAKVLAEESKTN